MPRASLTSALLLSLLATIVSAQDGSDASWRGVYEHSRQLAQIAHEQLREGQLTDAMEVLGQAVDLDTPIRRGFDNGLASAAGGWHRQLFALDSEERYELLREWSMPTEARQSVRVLEAFVPNQAPPSVFARTLGERPRDNSFPIANVGKVSGLFSTAWVLVQAADDAGRLRRLAAELEQLAEQEIPNAKHVLSLARLIAVNRRDEKLVIELTERLTQLRESWPATVATKGNSFSRAWQYGHGVVDEGSVTQFTPLSVWSGAAWQMQQDRPHPHLGFIRLDRSGGHAGPSIGCVRRWTAPSAGVVTVTGTLEHPTNFGDGVRAQVIASSGGLAGQWTARDSTSITDVDTIAVAAGDTIDFVIDMIEGTADDSFIWICQLRLKMGATELVFDSFDDFCGPHDANMLSHAVIAAACLERDWLQPIGESIFATLIENTHDADMWMNRPGDSDSPLLRPALRRAWALAIRRGHGDSESSWIDEPSLNHFIPASGRTAAEHARGHARHAWMAHEDHLLHLAGSGSDCLLLKYPLTGDFQFSVEAQAGGRPGTDGGVSYAGLGYLLNGCDQLLTVADATGNEAVRSCPQLLVQARPGGRYVSQPKFNRVTLAVTSDQTTMLLNGQAVWSDTSRSNTAPWLGLNAQGDHMPMFRDVQISGDPVIPREVRMSAGDSLRGWSASYYGDRLPPELGIPAESGHDPQGKGNYYVPDGLARHVLGTVTTVDMRAGGPAIASDEQSGKHDWFAEDGVIHGLRREPVGAAVAQSCLSYVRPLLEGESVSYEFLYEPDKYDVHPVLGRLVFLIERGGVRLHWITDGDREWTGLAEDNAIVEPFDRRGPKALPLVEADWNRLTIALAVDTVKLSLNDRLVYQRKLDGHDDRTFGFYHDACRSDVQVKNVVMRGDWPERLTAGELDNLAAVSVQRSKADRLTLNELFREEYLTDRVLQVARRAAGLPDDARYAYLAEWVLPSDSHASIRMVGRFAPPPVAPSSDQQPIGVVSPLALPASSSNRLPTGAQLIAPALELVNVAKRLGRLDDIQARLTDPESKLSGQAGTQRLGMLAVAALASGDFAVANEQLARLVELNNGGDKAEPFDRWPEMLAAWSALRQAETQETARELIEALYERVRSGKLGESDAWKHHVASLSAAYHIQDALQAFGDTVIAETLEQWDTVSHVSARSRGQGFPASGWARLPYRVDNIVAHDRDYMYFQSPLRGNFQVECDVTSSFYYRESSLAYAGWWTQPAGSLAQVGVGGYRTREPVGEIIGFDPKLTDPGPWMRYRFTVQDGRMKVYCNGRFLYEREAAQQCDPWLAMRTHWERNGGIRDVRISGEPMIPEQIELSSTEGLRGWLPYFDEPMGIDSGGWHFADGELRSFAVGQVSTLPGQDSIRSYERERLLHYHRPMLEDGRIEYEFFYEPEKSHVYPALDRLALLLEPDGVREHWATNGEYDETGLDPANVSAAPQHRRGPERLPLVPGAWNNVQLTLTGDTIAVMLNGQLVYERPLEPTNLRNFGLFHYADSTAVRARNIVWRGDWPRELPPVAQQELTDISDVTAIADIDTSLAELPSLFEHEFSAGLASSFAVFGNGERDLRVAADGLHAARPASLGDGQIALLSRFRVSGDFDILIAFDQLVTQTISSEPQSHAGIYAYILLENATNDSVFLTRKQHPAGFRQLEMGHGWRNGADNRQVGGDSKIHDGSAGTIRFARRGDTIYCMFADGDSAQFHILDQYKVPPGDIPIGGIRLTANASGGATAKVVWKKITIRATKLSGVAAAYPQQRLAGLNEQRDKLSHQFLHDFSKQDPTGDRFRRWGRHRGWDAKDQGFRVAAPGTAEWSASGLLVLRRLQGDFDVDATFDLLKLDKPAPGLNSGVYLQIELPDKSRSRASVFLNVQEGRREVIAELGLAGDDGNHVYRQIGIMPVKTVSSLRFARQGKRFYFMVAADGSDQHRILAHIDLDDQPLPRGSIRLIVRAGGTGRETEVLWKKIVARAAGIDPKEAE